jgi:hypothetical protein
MMLWTFEKTSNQLTYQIYLLPELKAVYKVLYLVEPFLRGIKKISITEAKQLF